MRRKPRLKLYWCTTDDGDEDWFVVARSAHDARRFHEGEEGYRPGDAACELITCLPDTLQQADREGWPSDETLTACGCVLLSTVTPRVVLFDGELFTEGALQFDINSTIDDVEEARGNGRPNRTAPMQ